MPEPVMPKKLKQNSSTKTYKNERPKKYVLFITGKWNVKVGSHEIPGVTGKFALGVQNEARKRLTRVLPKECTGHSKHPL